MDRKCTYHEKTLQISSWCNTPQYCKSMVEFNPKGRSNLQEWLLRKMNFRDAGWGPTTEVVCYQFVEGRSKNMAFKKKKNHKHAYGRNESRNRSQKALKLQVPNAYFLMKVWALAHRNKIASARIKVWQTKVSRWYSNNSKRTQIAVAPPSTPAEIFLFLHKKTSAAAINQFNKYSGTQREEQTTGLNNTKMLSIYIFFWVIIICLC